MKQQLTERNYLTNARNVQQKIDEVFAEKEIPANDSVRLLDEIVEEMNLAPLWSTYKRTGRKPATNPVTLFKVMLYANMEGIYSSRAIASSCRSRFVENRFATAPLITSLSSVRICEDVFLCK